MSGYTYCRFQRVIVSGSQSLEHAEEGDSLRAGRQPGLSPIESFSFADWFEVFQKDNKENAQGNANNSQVEDCRVLLAGCAERIR